ncbi:hypothetical protein LOAG_05029 [Loa loa]|uniref:Uncharacterized protein n=1 Tax=Loa loa TaxID=7209 RepID=A0A1S0U1D0_LOALO|nr:hypothetical protein LOAG_05029 [Loa loa]EFO23456.1 hypothetical protein LOAG_05029 [Loa loa]
MFLRRKKPFEKLAACEAASLNFMEGKKLSTLSDLISMLRDFIFYEIPPAPDDLLFGNGQTKWEELGETNVIIRRKHKSVLVNGGSSVFVKLLVVKMWQELFVSLMNIRMRKNGFGFPVSFPSVHVIEES